jgi:hypothetical protein
MSVIGGEADSLNLKRDTIEELRVLGVMTPHCLPPGRRGEEGEAYAKAFSYLRRHPIKPFPRPRLENRNPAE